MKKPYTVILKNAGRSMTTTVYARSMMGAALIASVAFRDLGFRYRDILGVVDNNV